MEGEERAVVRALGRLFSWARRSPRTLRGPRVKGRGVEVGERRPYAPGDDVRRLDWTVYARLGRLVTRLMEDSADPRAAVVLDASASMACGWPPVWPQAQRLAAGLAAVALGKGAEARLLTGAGRACPAVFRGGRLLALWRWLAELSPGGAAGLEGARRALAGARHSRVLLVSDGFAPGLARDAAALRRAGHAVFVVLVAGQHDWDPGDPAWDPRGSNLAFVEAEGGGEARRVLDAAGAAALAARREAAVSAAGAALEERGLSWARAPSWQGFERLVAGLARGRGSLADDRGI